MSSEIFNKNETPLNSQTKEIEPFFDCANTKLEKVNIFNIFFYNLS